MTIREEWEKFAKGVYPKGFAHVQQHGQLRDAFFAGAASIVNMLLIMDDMSEEEITAVYDKWQSEFGEMIEMSAERVKRKAAAGG